MLELRNLEAFYGNSRALQGINLKIESGGFVAVIGRNGVGKSTLLKAVAGAVPTRSGRVVYDGTDLVGLPAHLRVASGISLVPEGRRIFPRMTVTENLELGAFLRSDKDGILEDMERVFDLFPRLKERLTQKSGTLSGGEQQMLAMGRALMAKPRLLLLDEPSMGLAPVLVEVVFETIKKVNEQGTTVLLVEQNALVALNIADHAYVLETGHITLEGPAKELANNDEVRKAYLGED